MLKTHLKKKHMMDLDAAASQEIIVSEAKAFLGTLNDLRAELIERDAAYAKAKASKDSSDMEHYHHLAKAISQKCLNYGRELCENPFPHWVDGNLSKEHIDITRHAYDVIRNKICSSINVFDSDLLPNARILLDFAEGRY